MCQVRTGASVVTTRPLVTISPIISRAVGKVGSETLLAGAGGRAERETDGVSCACLDNLEWSDAGIRTHWEAARTAQAQHSAARELRLVTARGGGAARDEARPGDTDTPRLVVTVSLDLTPGHQSPLSAVKAVKVTGPCQTRHCQGCHLTRLYRPGSQSLDPFSLSSLFPQITRVRGGSGP